MQFGSVGLKLCVHQIHQVACKYKFLGLTCRDSDWTGLWWGLRIWISSKFPSDTGPAGSRTTPSEQWFGSEFSWLHEGPQNMKREMKTGNVIPDWAPVPWPSCKAKGRNFASQGFSLHLHFFLSASWALRKQLS